MKKIIKTLKYFLATISLLTALSLTLPVLAQEDNTEFQNYTVSAVDNDGSESRIMNRLKVVAGQGGFITDGLMSIGRIVGLIINAFVSILGIIFVVLIVSSGYTWMTSEGNDEKIKKATDTIKASIIGLVITLSSWAIWNFIFKRLVLGS